MIIVSNHQNEECDISHKILFPFFFISLSTKIKKRTNASTITDTPLLLSRTREESISISFYVNRIKAILPFGIPPFRIYTSHINYPQSNPDLFQVSKKGRSKSSRKPCTSTFNKKRIRTNLHPLLKYGAQKNEQIS